MGKSSRLYETMMGDKTDLEKMLHRITQMISNLLESLDYLYEDHRISYNVSSYREILLKILLPIELKDRLESSKFKIRSTSNQNEFDTFTPKLKQKVEMDFDNGLNAFQHSYKLKLEDTKKEQSDSASENIDFILTGKEDKTIKKTNGSRLGPEVEENICKWAYQQANNGRNVLRREIIHLATTWARKKNLDFRGSNGWYNRFLNRNLGLKKLISEQKYTRNNLEHNDLYETKTNKWNFEKIKNENHSSDEEAGSNFQNSELNNKEKEDNQESSIHREDSYEQDRECEGIYGENKTSDHLKTVQVFDSEED